MKYKYIVIGAGAAGLAVSIGLAKAKKKVLLIEKNQLGGNSINFGCIPSKTLIASSKIAHNIKQAKDFGLDFTIDNFDTTKVFIKIKETINEIKSKKNETFLRSIGINLLKAKASFKTSKIIEATEDSGKNFLINAKKIIIAAGSHPHIPSIEGLETVPYDTYETIFNLEKIPKSLIIIGSGKIACELGQAFQRLGSKVSIIDSSKRVLPDESFEASKLIKHILEKEEIYLYLNSCSQSIKYLNDIFEVFIKNNETGYVNHLKAEKLLIATKRVPNIEELNLGNANIKYIKNRVLIDKYGRTNQKHIYAIGDIIGPLFFTHKSQNMAKSVLISLILPFFKKNISLHLNPKITFTDPEVASIGITEETAIRAYSAKRIATYLETFETLDRAICENNRYGFVKIITHKWSGEILGASIVGKRAGEMISEISIAMKKGIKLHSLSNIIHPYPTYGIAIRKAADKYLLETILKRKNKSFIN